MKNIMSFNYFLFPSTRKERIHDEKREDVLDRDTTRLCVPSGAHRVVDGTSGMLLELIAAANCYRTRYYCDDESL